MLIFKVMFWVYVLGVIVKAANTCKDHPRVQQPVNIGTDIVGLIISICITILFYVGIWG